MLDFLTIKKASIGYKKPLISEVNATLQLGSLTLLIGNNGVGKTTLLKSLMHDIPLLNGEIEIENKNINLYTQQGLANKISMVFSKAQIPTHFTTRDLISLGKYIHLPYYYKLENNDKKEINDIIQQLKLEEYAETYLHQLSDGNLQKAFIGRAIAQNSPLIILYEPTTHLDEENKIMILKLLRDLAKKHQKAILFSSHDWRLAKEFSDYIWLIQNEKLEQGLAEDILLQNNLLTHPKLFTINEAFQSPYINAPFLEKEMLYSALQKNFKKDLSSLKIEFKNNLWEISDQKSTYSCHTVAEIINTIKHIDL